MIKNEIEMAQHILSRLRASQLWGFFETSVRNTIEMNEKNNTLFERSKRKEEENDDDNGSGEVVEEKDDTPNTITNNSIQILLIFII